MKNLLKNKKVLVGGAVVVGVAVLSYLHNKGLKVLAKQTPIPQSGADGSLTSDTKINVLQNALAQIQAHNNANTQAQAILQTMPKPNLMPNINATNIFGTLSSPKIIASNNGVSNPTITPLTPIATPIVVSPSGIAVTNVGTLAPIGISGWFTTIGTGLFGAIPQSTIANLTAQIQNVTPTKP